MPNTLSSQALYAERLNAVLDHIAQHPASDLSLPAMAALASFSSFHFHRVFQSLMGETLKAFVTRSRLERAVTLMRTTPARPLAEVAERCGFGSAALFSRVFRREFGVPPSQADLEALFASRRQAEGTAELHARHFGASAPAQPAGSRELRIERRAALPLAYVRVVGGYLDPARLVAGYHHLEAWVDSAGVGRSGSMLIGMSIDDPQVTPMARCRYDFARSTEQRPRRGSGLSHRVLPACDWAVLPVAGDLEAVAAAWEWLFRHWLPASGWQPALVPAMEVFHRRPEEIGWDRFDLDCCLPLEPL